MKQRKSGDKPQDRQENTSQIGFGERTSRQSQDFTYRPPEYGYPVSPRLTQLRRAGGVLDDTSTPPTTLPQERDRLSGMAPSQYQQITFQELLGIGSVAGTTSTFSSMSHETGKMSDLSTNIESSQEIQQRETNESPLSVEDRHFLENTSIYPIRDLTTGAIIEFSRGEGSPLSSYAAYDLEDSTGRTSLRFIDNSSDLSLYPENRYALFSQNPAPYDGYQLLPPCEALRYFREREKRTREIAQAQRLHSQISSLDISQTGTFPIPDIQNIDKQQQAEFELLHEQEANSTLSSSGLSSDSRDEKSRSNTIEAQRRSGSDEIGTQKTQNTRSSTVISPYRERVTRLEFDSQGLTVHPSQQDREKGVKTGRISYLRQDQEATPPARQPENSRNQIPSQNDGSKSLEKKNRVHFAANLEAKKSFHKKDSPSSQDQTKDESTSSQKSPIRRASAELPQQIAGLSRVPVSGYRMDCMIRAVLVSGGHDQEHPQFEPIVTRVRNYLVQEHLTRTGLMLNIGDESGLNAIAYMRSIQLDNQPLLDPRRGIDVYTLDPQTGQERFTQAVGGEQGQQPYAIFLDDSIPGEEHFHGLLADVRRGAPQDDPYRVTLTALEDLVNTSPLGWKRTEDQASSETDSQASSVSSTKKRTDKPSSTAEIKRERKRKRQEIISDKDHSGKKSDLGDQSAPRVPWEEEELENLVLQVNALKKDNPKAKLPRDQDLAKRLQRYRLSPDEWKQVLAYMKNYGILTNAKGKTYAYLQTYSRELSTKRNLKAAKNKGMTPQEYKEHSLENAAKKKDMTVLEYKEWVLDNTAKNKDMTVPEYNKWRLENAAKKKDMTPQEYNKWKLENAAKNKDMTVPEYQKWKLENAAKNKDMTVPEYKEWKLENAAKNKDMTVPEYNKWKLENAAKNKDMTVPEYKEWILENTAKNKDMTVPEYKEWVLENTAKNKGMTVPEYKEWVLENNI